MLSTKGLSLIIHSIPEIIPLIYSTYISNILSNSLLPLSKRCSDSVGGNGKFALTFESSHPYENSQDIYIPIKISNAKQLKIVFDEQSSTEKDCDYVKFYKDSNHSDTCHIGIENYTGGLNGSVANWPGVNEREPLIIEGDSCELYFHSDGSVNSVSQ